jgi:hypothetical protein
VKSAYRNVALGLTSIWTRRRVILWQAIRGSVDEVYISCPCVGFVLHVDWGIRRLPRGSCAHPRFDYPCGRFLSDPSLQRAPGCVNSTNALGEHRALSRTDRLSRIPSNRTRLVVPDVELLAASLSRPTVASARVFVFTSDNVGVCMDDEHASAYSGY